MKQADVKRSFHPRFTNLTQAGRRGSKARYAVQSAGRLQLVAQLEELDQRHSRTDFLIRRAKLGWFPRRRCLLQNGIKLLRVWINAVPNTEHPAAGRCCPLRPLTPWNGSWTSTRLPLDNSYCLPRPLQFTPSVNSSELPGCTHAAPREPKCRARCTTGWIYAPGCVWSAHQIADDGCRRSRPRSRSSNPPGDHSRTTRSH